MKKIKILFNIIFVVLMVFLIGTSFLSAMSMVPGPQKTKVFVVQSGSMEPSIKRGSIVFVRQLDRYVKGDVVTIKVGEEADIKNPKATITHRIIEIAEKDDKEYLITKGDANNAPDLVEWDPSLVVGKVTLSVPYLGYPVGYAKTQTGFIVMIVIPATIIIYSEFLNIKKEVVNILNSKKAVKKKSHEKTV